jgi:transcriptional/translational regulatory protein YebC/TACO1
MFLITTDPTHLYAVRDAINHLGFNCESAELEMIPRTYVETDVETAKENIALIDWLEELEDVDAVFHNMKIPDELQSSE